LLIYFRTSVPTYAPFLLNLRKEESHSPITFPMSSLASMAAHPLQAVQEAAGKAGADPRMMQRSSLFGGANDGPAAVAAKITGVQGAGKRVDDGPYFTNYDGIPFPDPAHSKTVGGIPVISDIHLLQKQQTFNRSKNLERMVHPCGSGAFGHFEVTKDVSSLTKVRRQEVAQSSTSNII